MFPSHDRGGKPPLDKKLQTSICSALLKVSVPLTNSSAKDAKVLVLVWITIPFSFAKLIMFCFAPSE